VVVETTVITVALLVTTSRCRSALLSMAEVHGGG
jgi:hypothetical protein